MISRLISLIGQHRKILLFAVFCFLLIPTAARAQYSLGDHNKALADPAGRNKQKFDQQTFAGFINSGNVALTGCQEGDCPKELKVGAIGVTSQIIAGLYANPPASGFAYVQDVIHRLNPVQPAYAQTGTGFDRLRALQDLWRTFRNFAYVAFAIVFVAIGLAIMFRMKLDPRTSITIQSAIPRIVVALLLVTFSYAIAGFMIDLMYVAIALVALLFGGGNPQTVASLQTQFTTGGFGVLWGHLWGLVGGGWNIATFLGGLGAIALLVPLSLINPFLGGAAAVLGIGASLWVLVLLIIILFILFRLFLELVRAYIEIILAVILGPLQIALGAIPGLPGFGGWLRWLAMNLSIFVAVAFVIMLGGSIVGVARDVWVPPLLPGGGIIAFSLPTLIAIGVLLLVHQIPQAVRNAFAGRPPQFAVGEALGWPRQAGRTAGLFGAARTFEHYEEVAAGANAPQPWWTVAGRRILGIRRQF